MLNDGFTALGDKPCDNFRQARELAEDVCQCGYYKSSHRAPKQPADAGEWRVEHDGCSRPIILTSDGRWLSVSQWEYGRWVSYEQEEADCAAIVTNHQTAALVPELVEALKQVRQAYNAGPSAERIRIAMDAAIDYVDAALQTAGPSGEQPIESEGE